MKYIIIALYILFSLSETVLSQKAVYKLWPKGVPDAIVNDNYKERVVKAWGRDSWAGVSDPEIQVCPAPAEISNGTAVIICPGGGYGRIAYTIEGDSIASWFNENGVTGIILKYRLPSDSIMKDKTIGPLQDAQEAVRMVRRNAIKWGIKPDKIGIMGSSAGGHLASTLCTHYSEKTYPLTDSVSARPDFAILCYPVISMIKPLTHTGSRNALLGFNPDTTDVVKFSNELQVTPATPPTFLFHSSNDGAVPVENSIYYFLALQKNKVKSEMRIYQYGGHGYSLAKQGTTEKQWPADCLAWMKLNGFKP